MDELNEKGTFVMIDHILIRDKGTKQTLINKRGMPIKKLSGKEEESNERNS